MAIEVTWSDEAIKTFQENLDYLQENWSDKEVVRFIQQTENIIIRLKKLPESYPRGIKIKNIARQDLTSISRYSTRTINPTVKSCCSVFGMLNRILAN